MYTTGEHRRTIDKNILPTLGDVRLDRLSAEHLDRFNRTLRARGLSASSVRPHHAIFSASLRQAVKWGWLSVNPADAASPPRPERPSASAPDPATVKRPVAAAQDTDPVLAAAIVLAAVTGARRGELCALRWSDIDWNRRTLTIARSLTVVHQQATEGPTKTHQHRVIAVDDALGAFLAHRQTDQRRYAQTAASTSATTRSSSAAPPRVPLPAYPTPSPAATAPHHQARSRWPFPPAPTFAATTAIASGADVRTVAGRLGHADPTTTLRIYAHAVESRDRDLAGVLGHAVLGATHHAVAPVEADRRVHDGGKDRPRLPATG